MTNTKKEPAATLRDGAIKATIWANPSDKGTFYSVDISRTFKKDDEYKNSHSFSGTDILKAQRLLGGAYDHIQSIYEDNRDNASTEAGGVA